MQLDRRLNFVAPPAFLRAVQPRERAWWRILLTIVLWIIGGLFLAVVTYFAAEQIKALLITEFGVRPPASQFGLTFRRITHHELSGDFGLISDVADLISAAAVFGSFAWAIVAAAAFVDGRPMMTWLTAAPRFRWRLLLAGLALSEVVVVGMTVIEGAAGGWPKTPPLLEPGASWIVRGLYLAAALLVVPLAAAAEEILTRGWLMQLTAAFTRNIVPIVTVNAVVFDVLHWDGNLYANIGRLYSGVAWSVIALRLGGLEFGIGLHAANNLLIALFVRPLLRPFDESSAGWIDLMLDLIQTTAALGLAELVVRWAPLRRWTGAAECEEPPSRMVTAPA